MSEEREREEGLDGLHERLKRETGKVRRTA